MIPPPDESIRPKKTARQQYREAMAHRQQKVFGIIIAASAVALGLALLILTGILPLPIGNDFTQKIAYADFDDTPCPSPSATSLPANGIKVQVLNASSTSGVAGALADELKAAGYEITLVDNSPEPFRGNIQINVGLLNVDQAYSLGRLFPSPIRIILENLPPGTITIVLGEAYDKDKVPPGKEMAATLASGAKLEGLPECLPIDPKQLSQLQQSGGQSGAPQSNEPQSSQ